MRSNFFDAVLHITVECLSLNKYCKSLLDRAWSYLCIMIKSDTLPKMEVGNFHYEWHCFRNWGNSNPDHILWRNRVITLLKINHIYVIIRKGRRLEYISISHNSILSWWRHQMEKFSTLLALCAGNSPVTGEFPSQRPVTQSFDVFFELRLNRLLSKQSRRSWFETPSRSLWRHHNALGRVNASWPSSESTHEITTLFSVTNHLSISHIISLISLSSTGTEIQTSW